MGGDEMQISADDARRMGVRRRSVFGGAAGAAIWFVFAVGAVCAFALAMSQGCLSSSMRPNSRDYEQSFSETVTATGYCNCQICCDWKYTWYGRPVTKSGRPKKIGLTASGTRARHGTIAADTSLYPMGTIIEIPGYGFGRVEDRGGAIKNKHIDLWFRRHADAKKWGKKTVKVKVWIPKNRKGVRRK